MYNKYACLLKYLHAHIYSYYKKYKYAVLCFLIYFSKPLSYLNLGHEILQIF